MGRFNDRKHHILYRTTCTVTGRYYLGMHSTNDLGDGYLGSGRVLRRSIQKYGVSAHALEILGHYPSRDELKARERDIIHEGVLRDPMCMNLTVGGEGGPTRTGHVHRPESKERISRALTGHVHSAETRARIGTASKGRGKGVPLSTEVREKISLAHSGVPSPLRGVPRDPEVCRKISAAVRAYVDAHPRPRQPPKEPVPVDVTRSRLSEAAKRQWSDPDKRRRMMEARAKPEDELTFYCDNMRHLVCLPYSVHNLHRMAKELQISRCWFHNSKGHPHYDIPKRRIAEIQARCTVVSPRDILRIMKGG